MHVIDSLEFDVSLADEALAFDLQGPLQAFLRGPALRIIDEVFAESSASDEVLRLGQLTIDLGRVGRSDTVAQWQRRLRERLHDELQGLRWRSASLPPAALSAHAQARPQRRAQADIEMLLHYLQHGTLRWHGVVPARQGLAVWADGVIARNTGAVVNWLHHAQPREALLRRLTLQLPERALEALAARFAAIPRAGEVAPPTWQALIDAAALGVPPAGAGAPVPALRSRLWQVLLGELLAAKSKPLALRELRAALRRETGASVAAQGSDEPPSSRPVSIAGARRARVAAASEGGAPPPPRRPPMPLPDRAGRLPQGRALDEFGEGDALALARDRVEAALGQGRPPAAPADWALLRDQDPGWLRLSLRRHGRDEVVRRRLAERFDDAAVCDTIELLAPGEREFAGSLMHGAPVWLGSATARRPLAPALRQFTMAFLLADRGTVFNRRAYLGALLRQLAQQQGRSEHELMRDMGTALASSGAPLGLRGQMLVLLAELGGEAAEPAAMVDASAAAVAGGEPRAAAAANAADPAQAADATAAAAAVGEAARRSAREATTRSAATPLWRALQRADDAALREAMQALCGDGPTRRQLAGGGLSPSRLLALATRLEPAQSGPLRRLFGADERGGERAGEHADPGAGGPGPDELIPIGRNAVLRAAAWDLWFATWVASRRRGFDAQAFREGWARHLRRGAAASANGRADDAMALLHGLLQREADSGAPAGVVGAAPTGDAQAWRKLVERHGAALRRPLQRALADADFADRLCRSAPEAALQRLLALLRPRLLAPLRQSLDLVERAATVAAGSAAARRLRRKAWRFSVKLLFAQGWRYRHDDFLRRLADFVAGETMPAGGRGSQPAPRIAAGAGHLVLARALLDIGRRSHDAVAVALAQAVAAAPPPGPAAEAGRAAPLVPRRHAPAVSPRPALPLPARTASAQPSRPAATPSVDDGEPHYLDNAGLVLLASYLPRLFSMLALTDGAAFVSPAAAERAVHLLQWLVDGRGQADEPALVLNKLLCGLDFALPVARELALTAHEQDTAQQLLLAVIGHWRAIGSTSVAGLRETFLQREGRLVREDAHWRLRVAPRAFDMLLDRLPWGFAMVKLPWMPEVLHVDWR